MKKIYEKPSVMVVKLQYKTNLLVDSPEPPPDAPDYDDMLE